MDTIEKQRQAVKQMQAVKRDPFCAVQMLASLSDEQTPFAFVGYTNYYLKYNGTNIDQLTSINLFCKRSTRLNNVLKNINECWLNGFIDDRQKRLLTLAAKVINTTIKRYFLIYLFL